MKQIVKKIDFLKTAEIILAVVLCVAPLSAAALSVGVPCGAGGIVGANCSGGTTVAGLITYVINIMLALAGLIAVLFLIIGGFRYIAAGGNAESAEAGRQTVVNAIIGIVIIALSLVIVNVVSNLVSNAGGTGTSGTGL